MLSKCKEYFFHKIHDIKNELLIIIHVDKNKCSKKKDKFFSRTKPRAFAQALYFETKGHLMMYFHQRPHFQTQEQIISFPIPRSCKISKANCFQFISKQFLLSKGKIKILAIGKEREREREIERERERVVLSELHLLRPPLDCSHF